MSIAETHSPLPLTDPETGIPYDSFAARLAVVRIAMGGLNVKAAAIACDIEPESWRRWEHRADSFPRDMVAVCTKIARHTSPNISRDWLMFGGPLSPRSRCFTPLPAVLGQIEFPFDARTPVLELASSSTDGGRHGAGAMTEGDTQCTTSTSTEGIRFAEGSHRRRSLRTGTN